MNPLRAWFPGRPVVRGTPALLAGIVAMSLAAPVRADLQVIGSFATVEYSVQGVTHAPSATIPGGFVFNSNGALSSVEDYFRLNGPSGLSELFTTGPIQGVWSTTADPDEIGEPPGVGFGSGQTSLSTSRPSSSLASLGFRNLGLFWRGATISSSAPPTLASVSVSTGTVTVINNGLNTPTITGTPSLDINLAGNVTDDNLAFVAASLTGSITTIIAGKTTTQTFASIVLAFDGDDPATRNDVGIAGAFASLNHSGLSYNFSGTSRLPTVTLNPGDVLSVSATMTLISGGMPPSVFFGNPAPPVPEPSAAVGSGIGLALLAAARWRRRSARVPSQNTDGGESRVPGSPPHLL